MRMRIYFIRLKIFTVKNQFKLDSQTKNTCESSVSQLISEISDILVNEIPKYRQHGFDPICKVWWGLWKYSFRNNKFYKTILPKYLCKHNSWWSVNFKPV